MLHIETTGSGPALVLLHGWGLHGGVFEPLVRRLAHRYRLHLVDLPGHGHSRGDGRLQDVDACIDELLQRTPQASWLGWSLGGLLALRAAAVSAQVTSLVLVAASPSFVRRQNWPHAVEPEVFERFASDLRDDYPGTLQRFLALDTLGSEHARAELRSLKEALYLRGEPSPQALQAGLALLHDSDLRACLGQLARPSLWISGRRDRLVPAAAMATAAALSGGEHVDIAGAGHAPFLGHADQVAAAIAGFHAGLATAQALRA